MTLSFLTTSSLYLSAFPAALSVFPAAGFPFAAFGTVGKEGPAEDSGNIDTDKDADTVNEHVLFGRAPAGDHGLVVFVGGGKTAADEPGEQHQPNTPQPISIEWDGNRNGQNTVFGHVGQFADVVMVFFNVIVDFLFTQIFVQGDGAGLDDDTADTVTQLCRFVARLGGKGINHIHNTNSRKKR